MRKKKPYKNSGVKQSPEQISKESGLPVKTGSKGTSYIPVNAVNPINNYGMVMYGEQQPNNMAPLQVPSGFITEIPYRSGINSTVIQNPSPIPVQTYWNLVVTEPVCSMNMLYWVTQIVTRIGEYTNSNKEYENHIRKSLSNIGYIKFKKALASSIYMGVTALKLDWQVDEDTNRTIVNGIYYIPPESMLISVEPEGGLDPQIGIMQRYYGSNRGQSQAYAYNSEGAAPYAGLGTPMIPNRQVGVNLAFVSALPEMWRIVHTFNPFGHNGNHWGFSFMQSSYGFVCQKYNFVQKAQIAATYKSAPMVLIETNTETTVEYEPNKFEPLSTNLTRMLSTMAGSGYGVIDGLNAIKVNLIDNTADMEKIWYPVDKCDAQISMAHCVPNLIGNSGSYANGKVNIDTHKDLVNNITMQFIETMQTQFVKRSLHVAFGNDIEDYGQFELKDNSLDDELLWGKKAVDMRNAGLLDPTNLEQVNFFLHKLGLPPVDKVSQDILISALDSRNDPSNISDAKSAIGQPYAKGLDNHEGKFE